MIKRKTKILKAAIIGTVFMAANLFLSVPAFAQEKSDIIPCDGLDCKICDIFELVSNVVNFAAFTIAAPLGAIILIYGGIMLITSGGNEKKKSSGTNAVWAAVVGLFITFAAWVMVNTVLGALADKDFSESWYAFPGCEGDD
ncbi:MAG: hypothetical protein HUT38_00855 [Candidatus Paceibacter sp.]|nr:hypothetical protein [Candidatus Paceibacter sp.]